MSILTDTIRDNSKKLYNGMVCSIHDLAKVVDAFDHGKHSISSAIYNGTECGANMEYDQIGFTISYNSQLTERFDYSFPAIALANHIDELESKVDALFSRHDDEHG
jgi:hypothetical protein